MRFPHLTTDRLTIRPFRMEDAQRVKDLAGAREIAINTLLIPHPYPVGAAEEWIASQAAKLQEEGSLNLAVDDGELVGAIGLRIMKDHNHAEIGYWIGVPYWGRGYATEAVGAVIRYGFEELRLNKIYAAYFSRNAASGRVMQKNGMRHEGTLRQHHRKWSQYVDLEFYGILSADFLSRSEGTHDLG
ncbi:MAG TPA: GNAT family protein [Thermoanaerobaculia bacterium]|nr:GNAT family protein [Thermoanaerobaculia bacterium]